MMLYALGALKLYRPIYGDAIKRVTVCIDQPRLNSYEMYGLPVEALFAWGENVVKPKAALAFAGLGEYAPGDWCRFCRAKAICRARADNYTALEDFKDLVPEGKGGILSNAEIGNLLIRAKALSEWYNDMKDYALETCLNGGAIPGWKAVEGRSSRAWADQDQALAAILGAGFDKALVYDTVPKSLAQLEKMLGAKPFDTLVGGLVVKPPGKPALAPESDSRPPYAGAAADFTGVGV